MLRSASANKFNYIQFLKHPYGCFFHRDKIIMIKRYLSVYSATEKNVLLLSSLGGMLEMYDFMIYGVFLLYFSEKFFPGQHGILSILEAYAVAAISYFMRPFGGLIFSHIGDEYGRKKVLVITITLMAICSIGIGILPTYLTIGIWAPILMIIFRCVQGLAFGGELPTTYVYIRESLHQYYWRGFSIVLCGINLGIVLSLGLNLILTHILSNDELCTYGWRIPFLLGGCIGLISYKIRSSLKETLNFKKLKPIIPIVEVFKHYKSTLFKAVCISSLFSIVAMICVIYMPVYLKVFLKLPPKDLGNIIFFAMMFNVIAMFITGVLFEGLKPAQVLKYYILISIPIYALAYYLLSIGYIFFGVLLLSILEGFLLQIVPFFLTELFPTEIRLTGTALSYNISLSIFGGLYPIIFTKLLSMNVSPYLLPFMIITIWSILSLWVLKYIKINKTLLI